MAARSSSEESLSPPRTPLLPRCRCSAASRSSATFSNATTFPFHRRSCCSSLLRGLSPDNTRELHFSSGWIRGDSGLLELFYEHTVLAKKAGIAGADCRKASFGCAFHESCELVLPDRVYGRGGSAAGVLQRVLARDGRPLYFPSKGRNRRRAGGSTGRITDGHDGEGIAGPLAKSHRVRRYAAKRGAISSAAQSGWGTRALGQGRWRGRERTPAQRSRGNGANAQSGFAERRGAIERSQVAETWCA